MARITSNAANITSNTNTLNAHGAQLTDHESRIGANEANITNNTVDIATNTDNIQQNKQLIHQNKDAIETNQKDIATNKETIEKGINVGDGSTSTNYALGDTIHIVGADGNIISTTTPTGIDLKLGDTLNIADSIYVGNGEQRLLINGSTQQLTGLSNIVFDESQITANRAATEGQVADVYNFAKSINVQGSGNILVTQNGTKFTVELVKLPAVEGLRVIGNDGSATTVSLTKQGLDVGGVKMTNLVAGDISANSTDAVTGAQLYEVKQAQVQLGQSLGREVKRLDSRISSVEKESRAGAAAAIAVASMPQAVLAGESMVSAGSGLWRGQAGYALGFSHATDNGKWVLKANVSSSSDSGFGGGLGVGYRW